MGNINLAAHVGHAVEHTPLWGMMFKVGAGIIAAAVVGAVCGAVGAIVAAAVVSTGGIAGVIGVMLVKAVVDYVVFKYLGGDALLEQVANTVDSMVPKEKAGIIATGSPNVFIGKQRKPLAVAALSEVLCSQHTPVQKAAEGSTSVHVNQQSGEGAPICLLHRKGERSTCDATTAEGEPSVHVGGDTQQVLPIESEMPWWLEQLDKFATVIGIGISLCTGQWSKIPSKLACLGLGIGIAAAVEYVGNSIRGNPVHSCSGAKVLLADDETDFTIPSRNTITWERFYSSLDTRNDGPHGQGWSVPYSVQLKLFQEGEYPAIFVGPQGREILFDEVKKGESLWNSAEGYGLFHMPNGEYVVQNLEGICFVFGLANGAEPHTLALQRVEDIYGNWLSLRYNAKQALHQIADSAGHLLEFEHSAEHPKRISLARVCDFDAKSATQQWRVLASYEYDTAGRLAAVVNALGVVTRRFAYGESGAAAGLMTYIQYASGLESRYEWGAFADHPRVVQNSLSSGRIWRFAYDLEQGSTTLSDSLGNVERWTWDDIYNPLTHTNALGQTTEYLWDESKTLVGVRLPNGALFQSEYDERGNIVKEISANGAVYSRKWHHRLPLLLEETNPAGNSTTWEYDDFGRLNAVVDPAGGRTKYWNDKHGQPVAALDPNGGEYGFVWNNSGLLTRFSDCSGKITSYNYDAFGNTQAFVDPLGQTTRLKHDAIGRLITAELPDSSTRAYSYDSANRLSSAIDGNGQTSRLHYNLHGDVLQSVDPLGQNVKYSYDRVGNLAALINENGESYTFGYDAVYRQTSQTSLDGQITSYELDSLGLPIVVRQASGTASELAISLERDIEGRLLCKTTSETSTKYSYDPLGQITEIIRSDLNQQFIDSLSFKYDSLGNLVEEKTVVISAASGENESAERSSVLKHSYDPLGNRIQTILPDGRCLDYSLCGSGFVHQISLANKVGDIGKVISAFERDDLQRETLRTQGRRHARSSYDPLSRLRERFSRLRSDLEFSDTNSELRKEYNYDKNGELTSKIDNFSGARSYAYDAAGRITGSSAKIANSQDLDELLSKHTKRNQIVENLFKQEKFSYDAASNLLSTGTDDLPLSAFRPVRTDDFGGVAFDDFGKAGKALVHNRLREYKGIKYEYDAFGRTTQKDDQEQRLTYIYRYNCEHQLVEVLKRSKQGFVTTKFSYDALGRRICKEVSSNRYDSRNENTIFVWDGMRLLQEIREGQEFIRGKKDQDISTYLYEQDSYAPLARIDNSLRNGVIATELSDAKVYYFHCNASGLPEELTDQAGQLVWRARYSTWGKLVFENISHFAPKGFSQNLRMQGQYADKETGLYYNTFRYYDPEIGRFTTEDPIGLLGGVNLYQYAPNPLMWIDPWGWAGKKSQAPLSLPDGYTARIDSFNVGNGSSFEVHVYSPNNQEVGIYGQDGFFNKHGTKATDVHIPKNVANALNGIAVNELRKRGQLPPKGTPNSRQEVKKYSKNVKNKGC